MKRKAGDIIKKERRKSFLFREFSRLFQEASYDEPALTSIYMTRVEISPGNGMCTIYFASLDGKEAFLKTLDILKLYKPSFKTAFAQLKQSRHTPDFTFAYDETVERVDRINRLLDEVKK